MKPTRPNVAALTTAERRRWHALILRTATLTDAERREESALWRRHIAWQEYKGKAGDPQHVEATLATRTLKARTRQRDRAEARARDAVALAVAAIRADRASEQKRAHKPAPDPDHEVKIRACVKAGMQWMKKTRHDPAAVQAAAIWYEGYRGDAAGLRMTPKQSRQGWRKALQRFADAVGQPRLFDAKGGTFGDNEQSRAPTAKEQGEAFTDEVDRRLTNS